MFHTALFWAILGFLLGAIPFSLLLGHLFLHADIRRWGDGNPGGANAWRAGTWRLGVPAVLLDYLKGAVPVSLAQMEYRVSGWGLVAVALAPVLGHAFSPFLRFRGGKALAVTFGIWTGLTVWEGPTFLGLGLALMMLLQDADAWAVILGMFCFLGYLLLRGVDRHGQAVWAGNLLILAWKHRSDLRESPRMRPFLRRLFRRHP